MTADAQGHPTDDAPIDTPEGQEAYIERLFEWARTGEVSFLIVFEMLMLNLDDWIRLATEPRPGRKTTSTKAARHLCRFAAACLDGDHPMPDALQQFMVRALYDCAAGKDANVALRLKSREGSDPIDEERKNVIIANFVFCRIAEGREAGESFEEAERRIGVTARAEACTRFAGDRVTLDDSTVAKIWRAYKPPPAVIEAWLKIPVSEWGPYFMPYEKVKE